MEVGRVLGQAFFLWSTFGLVEEEEVWVVMDWDGVDVLGLPF